MDRANGLKTFRDILCSCRVVLAMLLLSNDALSVWTGHMDRKLFAIASALVGLCLGLAGIINIRCIYGISARKSTNIPSFTVYIYGSGQP
jgi:hypothetical protein